MTKRTLVEMGIHKTFNEYRKNPKAKLIPNQRKVGNLQNIKAFGEYLSGLVKRKPIVGEFIQELYDEGKDIMRLYKFFYKSKLEDFNRAKLLTSREFMIRDDIVTTSLAGHISLSEFAESTTEE